MLAGQEEVCWQNSWYDNTVEHTVGTVNGQYWFKVDIGTQEGEPDTEEEPV